MCALFSSKLFVIKMQRRDKIQFGKDPSSGDGIKFGDSYSVLKQRFTYQEGKLFVTVGYRIQKTPTSLDISENRLQRRIPGVICHGRKFYVIKIFYLHFHIL
jgi:hypothetical protein